MNFISNCLAILLLAAIAVAQSIALPYHAGDPLPANFRAVQHGAGFVLINDGPAAVVPVTVLGFPLQLAKTFNQTRGNWLLRGEAILSDNWAAEPPTATRLAIKALLSQFLDVKYIERPRIMATLRNIGAGSVGDFAWTSDRANRKPWLGEALPPADQFHVDVMNPIGAEGWNNGHYDLPFWALVNWAWNGDQQDYYAAVRWGVAQSTTGFVWSGFNKGRHRQEKGYLYPGCYLDPSDGDDCAHEKSWIRPAGTLYYATGMPIFRMVCELHRDYLRTIPANWWNGAWGERQPARILDDMHFLEVAMGYPMGDRAEPFARHVLTHLDPVRKIWINKGNAEVSSPWQTGELVQSLREWAVRRQSMRDIMPLLQTIADATVAQGINRQHGFPLCFYRFAPSSERFANQNFGLSGFLLPMLRWSHPALAEEIKDTTAKYLPALVSQSATIPPISDIRCNYGPQGSAHYKLMLEVLHGVRK